MVQAKAAQGSVLPAAMAPNSTRGRRGRGGVFASAGVKRSPPAPDSDFLRTSKKRMDDSDGDSRGGSHSDVSMPSPFITFPDIVDLPGASPPMNNYGIVAPWNPSSVAFQTNQSFYSPPPLWGQAATYSPYMASNASSFGGTQSFFGFPQNQNYSNFTPMLHQTSQPQYDNTLPPLQQSSMSALVLPRTTSDELRTSHTPSSVYLDLQAGDTPTTRFTLPDSFTLSTIPPGAIKLEDASRAPSLDSLHFLADYADFSSTRSLSPIHIPFAPQLHHLPDSSIVFLCSDIFFTEADITMVAIHRHRFQTLKTPPALFLASMMLLAPHMTSSIIPGCSTPDEAKAWDRNLFHLAKAEMMAVLGSGGPITVEVVAATLNLHLWTMFKGLVTLSQQLLKLSRDLLVPLGLISDPKTMEPPLGLLT